MSEKKPAKPHRIEVFPKQPLPPLPSEEDVELAIVPKQVVKIQGLSPDESEPTLTVSVNSSGHSNLHFVPQSCVSGTSACLDKGGMQEIWVPQASNDSILFDIVGLSSPKKFRLPTRLIDQTSPLTILLGDILEPLPKPPFPNIGLSPATDFDPSANETFITLSDSKDLLAARGLKKGLHDPSTLSDAQRKLIVNLIKEAGEAMGQAVESSELLTDFGKSGRFYITNRGESSYIIFKGYAGLRKIFKGTRYSVSKNFAQFSVLSVAEGLSSSLKAGITRASKGTVIGFIWLGVVDWHEWDEQFIGDFLMELGSDAVQMVVGNLAAAFAVSLGITGLRFAGFIAAGATVSVMGVVIGTIVVGFIIGMGLNYLDDHYQLTDKAKNMGRNVETSMKEMWKKNVEDPALGFLYELDRQIRGLYAAPY